MQVVYSKALEIPPKKIKLRCYQTWKFSIDESDYPQLILSLFMDYNKPFFRAYLLTQLLYLITENKIAQLRFGFEQINYGIAYMTSVSQHHRANI